MFEEGVLGASLFLLFIALLATAMRRMLVATDCQYGVLAGLLVYCVSVSMFSGDLDDNRILWLWAGVILAVCRNTYLESRRRRLLERFRPPIESPVPALSTARSVFAHPHAIKG